MLTTDGTNFQSQIIEVADPIQLGPDSLWNIEQEVNWDLKWILRNRDSQLSLSEYPILIEDNLGEQRNA